MRKLISNALLLSGLSSEAETGNFEFIPPKKKGVPKLIREMVDTYIVTIGDSYNLQVWNRCVQCAGDTTAYQNFKKKDEIIEKKCYICTF